MDQDIAAIIEYMKSHWPSPVEPKWQVSLEEYPLILKKVLLDFTEGKTRTRHFLRIAGLSGSGKTTQLLPAAEEYCPMKDINPVLVAARAFVPYHPYYNEILNHYGKEKLRLVTDEFATIMLALTIKTLIQSGYDIILDVTLLDPTIEAMLTKYLSEEKYDSLLLMVAVSPEITEQFLSSRSWRHTKETEQEFIRATKEALHFYAEHCPDFPTILWNTYEEAPVYNGPIKDALATYEKYSSETTIPDHDEEKIRKAKVSFLKNYNH